MIFFFGIIQFHCDDLSSGNAFLAMEKYIQFREKVHEENLHHIVKLMPAPRSKPPQVLAMGSFERTADVLSNFSNKAQEPRQSLQSLSLIVIASRPCPKKIEETEFC